MADRVTIVDVAHRAGVAISSVSSALNDRPGVSEQTRARIIAAANELGFVPSLRGRSLSGKKAFAVGLVVHREPDVLELDPFFASFIGGIESVLDKQGYALVLQIGAEPGEMLNRYRRLAGDRRVDGVFLSEIEIDDPRIPLLQDLALPAVAINADDGSPFPTVRQDGDAGIRSIIDYLVDAGHTRIAHVAGPEHFVHARQRRNAWSQALNDVGLEQGAVAAGGFTYEGGAQAATELLGLQARPTAVVCANDLSAIGFIAEAQRMGFDVPKDVSVTGYDGIQLGSYVTPTLTTLRTSPRQIGAMAARLLLDVVNGDADAGPVVDVEIEPVELVVRESTAEAPH